MDKLQFLDLSDLNPTEEQELNHLLYSTDFVVEMPPDTLPCWDPAYGCETVAGCAVAVVEGASPCCSAAWIPATFIAETDPVNGGGEPIVGDPVVEYTVANPHMIPGPQYTQMITQPNVYVNNVTANVNVHSFIPAPPYPAGPYVQPADSKPCPAKSPTKCSPPPNFTPPFPQPFPPQPIAHYPASAYYTYPIPHSMSRHFTHVTPMFSPTAAPVFGSFSPVYTGPVQQPPAEPRDDTPVSYVEQTEYQMQPSEENREGVDNTVTENSHTEAPVQIEEIQEEVAAPVVEAPPPEEPKVEKPLVTKSPPVNAFKATSKPPLRHRRDEGPQVFEPPVDTGPPKKSYAQMAQSSDSGAMKPLAMIHPTVHSSKRNMESPKPQNHVYKTDSVAPQQAQVNFYNNNIKVQSEKMIMRDHDINLQRLGEFLSSYNLDHKPLPLQPRGLTNRRYYCYINAILQALLACPPFYNLMKSIPASQENKGNKLRTPIINSMMKFVNEFGLTSVRLGRREKVQATRDGITPGSSEIVAGTTFEPTYIYKMLSAKTTVFQVGGHQEDAEEFLSCLLNGLHDEMLEAIKSTEPQSNGLTNGDVTSNGGPATNEDCEQDHLEWTEVVNKSSKSVITRRGEFRRTPLSAIFRGQMRSRVVRTGVENVTTDYIQPFFTLQLDIEKTNSVEKALELLSGGDEVQGGAVCPKTNQEVSILTQTSLEELPLILLLHLKCFRYKLQACSKIIKTVEFPIDLKIEHKLITGKSKSNGKDRQYKLLAVVYHDGKEATRGHYLTDVYHPVHSCWVRYDDATVRTVSQQQVLNPKPPRMPYLLYYRRCDTISPPILQDKNR